MVHGDVPGSASGFYSTWIAAPAKPGYAVAVQTTEINYVLWKFPHDPDAEAKWVCPYGDCEGDLLREYYFVSEANIRDGSHACRVDRPLQRRGTEWTIFGVPFSTDVSTDATPYSAEMVLIVAPGENPALAPEGVFRFEAPRWNDVSQAAVYAYSVNNFSLCPVETAGLKREDSLPVPSAHYDRPITVPITEKFLEVCTPVPEAIFDPPMGEK